MRTGTLGTLTIGQAPRPDVVPIIDRHVPERVPILPGTEGSNPLPGGESAAN
jgi:hypothetical protein